ARLGGAPPDRIGHRRFIGDVDRKGDAARLAGDSPQRLGAAVEQYQCGTFGRKKLRGTPADPGRRPGDQDPTLPQATRLSHRIVPSLVFSVRHSSSVLRTIVLPTQPFRALRARVVFEEDPTTPVESAAVTLHLADGTEHSQYVRH